MNKYIQEKEEDFQGVVDYFVKEISSIRTGRANPNILEGIQVDAYGVNTPLNGVASITIPDAQSIVVSPWDKGVIKELEKAIVEANLGVGIVNEGDQVRLTMPMMTEENRKEMVKKLNEKHEDARVKFRKIRDEIKTNIERAEKEKDITEDDKFDYVKELDDKVRDENDKAKEIRDNKEKDIMTI